MKLQRGRIPLAHCVTNRSQRHRQGCLVFSLKSFEFMMGTIRYRTVTVKLPDLTSPDDTNSDHARVHSEGLHSAVWERVALGVEPMRPTNQRDTAVVFSRVGV